ncbi:gp23 [Burkholderia lata]|nr:gp23 [Burkholderia lata]
MLDTTEARLVADTRHSAAPAGSPAAGDTLDLLADVLGRADQRAGDLAEYADRAGMAGQQCERDYDALTFGVH